MKKNITILIAFFFSASLSAQIPNGGFESWSNVSGYSTPDGWDNLNAMTSSSSVYTCTKGTPGYAGSAYLNLTSTYVSGMGVMPGVATCGTLDISNMSAPVAISGFACTQRPMSLDGMYQYMASGRDAGYISAMLTKWNAASHMRDTIATLYTGLSGMAMSWASFSYGFTYMSPQYPDTAFITLSASGPAPAAGSYLYVDTLHLAGAVAAGLNDLTNSNIDISLSPNPASDMLNIRFAGVQNTPCTIQLINTDGAIVKAINTNEVTNATSFDIDISGLAKGLYLVRTTSDMGIATRRVVIE